ncbi:hypothetical protein GUITHDRAFT_109983 [Guillardia theta CCMP2712]|uniref:Uncharacterized protein n=1 Tax=Guillardia theta (strain CCMP2712) TaxID=905079 RepID=L1J6P6_GUITC|nr:hypothetical protein GUITHDRAFT_109983 [Guillardia theta CCMP2712]EKX44196.1 hypothetical protein GUITHDRAFT_109983 [Guillardia theta CCMP2712]|eukprot:XP_005831176.1 hypothetical protein GUITHDRAFT_109983 [Guillardia theta CCMP2712]
MGNVTSRARESTGAPSYEVDKGLTSQVLYEVEQIRIQTAITSEAKNDVEHNQIAISSEAKDDVEHNQTAITSEAKDDVEHNQTNQTAITSEAKNDVEHNQTAITPEAENDVEHNQTAITSESENEDNKTQPVDEDEDGGDGETHTKEVHFEDEDVLKIRRHKWTIRMLHERDERMKKIIEEMSAGQLKHLRDQDPDDLGMDYARPKKYRPSTDDIISRIAIGSRMYKFREKTKLRALAEDERETVIDKVAQDLNISRDDIEGIVKELIVHQERLDTTAKNIEDYKAEKEISHLLLMRLGSLFDSDQDYQIKFKGYHQFLEWIFVVVLVLAAPFIFWLFRNGTSSDFVLASIIGIVSSVLSMVLKTTSESVLMKSIRCNLLVSVMVRMQWVVMIMDTLANVRANVTCINIPSLSLSLVFITFLQQINIVGGKKQTVKRMTEFITICCTIYAAIIAPVLSFFEKLALVIYIISGFVDALSDQIAFPWSVQEIYLVKEDQDKSPKYLSLMARIVVCTIISLVSEKVAVLSYKPLPSETGVSYEMQKIKRVVTPVLPDVAINCSGNISLTITGEPITFDPTVLALHVAKKDFCELSMNLDSAKISSNCTLWPSLPGCEGKVIPFSGIIEQGLGAKEIRSCLQINQECGSETSCGKMGCKIKSDDPHRTDCSRCFTGFKDDVVGFLWSVPVPLSSLVAFIVLVLTLIISTFRVKFELQREALAYDVMHPIRDKVLEVATECKFLNHMKLVSWQEFSRSKDDAESAEIVVVQ